MNRFVFFYAVDPYCLFIKTPSKIYCLNGNKRLCSTLVTPLSNNVFNIQVCKLQTVGNDPSIVSAWNFVESLRHREHFDVIGDQVWRQEFRHSTRRISFWDSAYLLFSPILLRVIHICIHRTDCWTWGTFIGLL